MARPEAPPPSPTTTPTPTSDSGKGGSGPEYNDAKGEQKLFPEGLLDWAKFYHYHGFNVLPIHLDSKKPAIKSWDVWQTKHQDKWEDVYALFVDKRGRPRKVNIAIVCGWVSGDLVVLDFDDEKAYMEFSTKLALEGVNLSEAVVGEDGFRRYKAWIVKTGRGFHVYLRPPSEVVENLTRKESDKVEVRANGHLAVAPPSIHPETKKPYEFIVGPTLEDVKRFLELRDREKKPVSPLLLPITKELWEKIVDALPLGLQKALRGEKVPQQETPKQVPQQPCRKLKPEERDEVVALVKPFYYKGCGCRNFWAYYLGGWCANNDICSEDAVYIISMLADYTQDEEKKSRIEVVLRTYEVKAQGRRVKGYTGVKELLEQLVGKEKASEIVDSIEKGIEAKVGEEKATEILARLEEILGPNKAIRRVFKLLKPGRGLFAVANLDKKYVALYSREGPGGPVKEYIFEGSPTQVIVYVDPFRMRENWYEVVWEMNIPPYRLRLGPAPMETIYKRLEQEGLTLSKNNAKEVLHAVLIGFIQKGWAEVREELTTPGFYLLPSEDGEVEFKAVGFEIPENLDVEALRRALSLLNWLHDNFYSYTPHLESIFSEVVKYAVIAPFSFILKSRYGLWIKWLYLLGPSRTGKTTLAHIPLYIWDLDPGKHSISGANVNTQAKLGRTLSSGTWIYVVNEPGDLFDKEDVVEMLKNAVQSPIARSTHIHFTPVDIPSYACLIFTSNKHLPKDDALLNRFELFSFSMGDVLPEDRVAAFKKEVLRRDAKSRTKNTILVELAYIGKAVVFLFKRDSKFLDFLVSKHKDDWRGMGKEILGLLYDIAKLPRPQWLDLEYREEAEDISEYRLEKIRAILYNDIYKSYTSFVGKLHVATEKGYVDTDALEVELRDVVKVVLERNMPGFGYAFLGQNGEDVYFTRGFAERVEAEVGLMGGLKGIAEFMQQQGYSWQYVVKKVGNKAQRMIKTTLSELLDFLRPEVEEPEAQQNQEVTQQVTQQAFQ